MIKPTYSIIAAVTIDGKIALGPNHNSSWTSKEDKDFLHNILDKSDVVIVGNNTYKAAKKPLSKRNCLVFTRKVKTIKRVNEKLLLCNPQNIDITKLIANPGYEATLLKNNKVAKSTEAIPSFAQGYGGLPSIYSSARNLRKAAKVGKKIALLGGAQTYTYFLEKNLIDDIYLTIEPLVFGTGINLFAGKKSYLRKFKLVSSKKLNKKGSILLHYKHLL